MTFESGQHITFRCFFKGCSFTLTLTVHIFPHSFQVTAANDVYIGTFITCFPCKQFQYNTFLLVCCVYDMHNDKFHTFCLRSYRWNKDFLLLCCSACTCTQRHAKCMSGETVILTHSLTHCSLEAEPWLTSEIKEVASPPQEKQNNGGL